MDNSLGRESTAGEREELTAPPPPGASPLDNLLSGRPGDRIGNYTLREQIGEGGFGVVYRAEQEEPLRREVALKVIKLGMDTRQVVARFEAERQALARMDHPNIAKVLDAGATGKGSPFFVMEFVRGARITDYCDQRQFSTRDRLALFILICKAVQHAHQKGIIHRDIKPSNVLVAEQDGKPVPKVIDFGIAKATQGALTDVTIHTQAQQFIGTPAYMSPEQAEPLAGDIDTRTDIYSLGVLLYELLTGRTPFDSKELIGGGVEEMRRTIREREPVRPSTRLGTLGREDATLAARQHGTDPARLLHHLRGDLDWIVMKCLEKDRARRYETANGLAADIERHLGNEPVFARPPSPFYRLQKLVRRNRLTFVAAGAVATALVVGTLVSTYLAVRASRAGSIARAALATSDFQQALRLIKEGNRSDALAYLHRGTRENPENGAALTRLTTLLANQSWMVPNLVLYHSNTADSVQFSPDAKRILTASFDGTARIWDAGSGQTVTPPMKHSDRIYCAAFSPDGSRVVTASADHTARIWDASNGRALAGPLQHGAEVNSAQFSRDGGRIVTASWDHTARVWDALTGKPITNPLSHKDRVFLAQFSPDGTKVVTASADGTARIWDALSGKEILKEPLRHGDKVVSAQFSPDGKRIATTSEDTYARIWDAENGQLSVELRHGGKVWSAEFSRDGRRVLTAAGDYSARVWDAWNGQLLVGPMRHGGSIWSAHFSGDESRIITGSADHTSRVWDAKNGQALTEPLKHGDQVWSSAAWTTAQFSPDGTCLLTPCSDGKARVWKSLGGPLLPEILLHHESVNSAQFAPGNERIVTASDDTVRIWDAKTGRLQVSSMRHNGKVRFAQFSRDGKRIVSASEDHTARVWDARTGSPVGTPMQHAGVVILAMFSPDGKLVVTASDTNAQVWDAESGMPITGALAHKAAVKSAEFSDDGKSVATASDDWTAQVWDAATGQAITPPLKHARVVFSARFGPKGKRIVTASDDYTARVWDVQSGNPVPWSLTHASAVRSAQFSPDGSRIVTASRDGTARIWDARSGKALSEPLPHDGEVLSAQFSPDGQRIVTASADGTARLWDAYTGQPLAEPYKHRGALSSAEFSPDGMRIVTVATNNAACVWDIAPPPSRCPGWLLRLSEAVSGEVLNDRGILELSTANRAEVIRQIRQEMAGDPDWCAWGRWFLTGPSKRTISPFSSVTITEYVEDRILENTAASLEEAEQLAVGNAKVLQQISAARKFLGQAKGGTHAQ